MKGFVGEVGLPCSPYLRLNEEIDAFQLGQDVLQRGTIWGYHSSPWERLREMTKLAEPNQHYWQEPGHLTKMIDGLRL